MSYSKAPLTGVETKGVAPNFIIGNALALFPGAISRVAKGVSSLIPILLLEVITRTGTEGSWLEVNAMIFPFSRIKGKSASFIEALPPVVPEVPPVPEPVPVSL